MNAIENVYKTQIKESIKDWGTDVTIFYYTTSQPAGAWDPINEEVMNSATDVDTDGWARSEQELIRKGAVNTFVTNKSKFDRALQNFGMIPDSDIRITFWLPDILINLHSATGATYLDNCEKVKVFSKYYKPKDRHITGINSNPYVCIVTGEEIKG